MIKINLLSATTPVSVKTPTVEVTPSSSSLRNFLAFAVTAVLAGGSVLVLYSIWSKDLVHWQQEKKKEELRQAELRGIQEQNRRYQQQLQLLETRINTIQMLQNSKSGPVDFMTALGDVVNRTTDLFLFTVQPDGERLAVKGQSTTVESMAEFIAALNQSKSFRDVQLRQYWEDDQQNRLTYKFNLDCIYKQPAAAQPLSAPVPASGAGRRTGM